VDKDSSDSSIATPTISSMLDTDNARDFMTTANNDTKDEESTKNKAEGRYRYIYSILCGFVFFSQFSFTNFNTEEKFTGTTPDDWQIKEDLPPLEDILITPIASSFRGESFTSKKLGNSSGPPKKQNAELIGKNGKVKNSLLGRTILTRPDMVSTECYNVLAQMVSDKKVEPIYSEPEQILSSSIEIPETLEESYDISSLKTAKSGKAINHCMKKWNVFNAIPRTFLLKSAKETDPKQILFALN